VQGAEIGHLILDAPLPYFEAKPERPVRFDEFAGAVVPKDASAAVFEILKRRGVPVRTYDPELADLATEADRIAYRAKVVRDFRQELHDQGAGTLFEPGAAFQPEGPAQQEQLGEEAGTAASTSLVQT